MPSAGRALRIGLVGAGVIGRTHAATLDRMDGIDLTAIADPGPETPTLGARWKVPHASDADGLLALGPFDGVIIASPNETHLSATRTCLAAGLPVLVEKPLSGTLDDGRAMIDAEARTGVPILVGHHRRHNPRIRAAHDAIRACRIGDLVIASVMSTLGKHRDYFDVPWRVRPGDGGPLLINTIHEIDLLRHFWGEIAEVRAVISDRTAGRPVEDTAAAILSFEKGGIATIGQTDAAAAPWAWYLTAGENRAFLPAHDTTAHHYAGTDGALSLPDLALWTPSGPSRDWRAEMRREVLPVTDGDAYVAQLSHFADVINGDAKPRVTAVDGLRNLAVVAALRDAARAGTGIAPERA